MSRNTADAPSQEEIRNNAAIPFASQIPNDTNADGDSLADVLNAVPEKVSVLVEGLDAQSVNEQSTAIGGASTNQFAPTHAIVHLQSIAGTALAGDTDITIGIASAGTEILAQTECTGLINVDDKFIIDLSAVVKPAMPADGTIFVKVVVADTNADDANLFNVTLVGEIIPTAA